MNDRVRIISVETLSRFWGELKRTVLDYRRADGSVQRLTRETYDHGNGAAILLCDTARGTVLLVRQFRLPVLMSGADPMVLEVCAGLLDGTTPLATAIREAEEETGVTPQRLAHVLDMQASPGSLVETISLFVGHYDGREQRLGGGGLAEEGEEIEVVEMDFATALAMIGRGEIVDAKTVVLLQHAALAGLFAESAT